MAALAVAIGSPVTAQGLRSDPITLAGGRVALGGDLLVVASCAHLPDGAGCGEDTGFFNYSDYKHSTVRLARLAFSASVRANRQFSFLTEVRSENGERPEPYALYARIRPWPTHAFDLQVGRIPPTFGTFGRRTYASDNLLIGSPPGLSVSDVVAPGRRAGRRGRAASDARPRLAVQLHPRQHHTRARSAIGQRVSLGYRHSSACRRIVGRRIIGRDQRIAEQSTRP